MTTIAKWMGGLLAAGLAVSACGGGSAPTAAPAAMAKATSAPASTSGPTTAAATATPAPTATRAPAPTATPVPVSSGTLKITLGTVLTWGLVPGISFSMNKSGIDPMYDSIVGLNDDWSLSNQKGFVSGWTVNADSTVWTLKTRDGVTFHDGSKATSKDIKGSLEWFASPDAQAGTATNARSAAIKSLETPDEQTMVMNLNATNIFALAEHMTLAGFGAGDGYLISKNYLDTKTFKEYNQKPIGSGPFKLNSFIVSQEFQYEAAGPHWLYGVPKYKHLSILCIAEDGTRSALLRSGGADAGEIPRKEAGDYKKAGFDVLIKENSKVSWGTFVGQWLPKFDNGVKNPFNDVRVREAFNLAIDRQEVVDAFMYGLATPTMDKEVKFGDPGYKAHPVPKKDVARAKQLLADAGYPTGFQMDLNLQASGAPGLVTETPQINEALYNYWKDIGIKINRVPALTGKTQATLSKDYTLPRINAAPTWGTGNPGHLRGLPPGAHLSDNINNRQTEDPEIEAAILAVGAARNVQEYITAAQKYQDLYIQKWIIFPLFQSGETFAAKKGLNGDKWSLGNATYNYNFAGMGAGRPEVSR